MEDKIEHDDWKITRTLKDFVYIYEFWLKPVPEIGQKGRYMKFIEENGEPVIIEDGPYLG